jgi:hypothetical protein
VLINGTNSTSLPQPLYPAGLAQNNVSLISAQGYSTYIGPPGTVAALGSVFFASFDCTGTGWRSRGSPTLPGQVLAIGPTSTTLTAPARLYYLPKVEVVVAQPLTRNSQSAGSSSACTVATTTLTNATGYWEVYPNNPAVTGVGIAADGLTVQVNYAP